MNWAHITTVRRSSFRAAAGLAALLLALTGPAAIAQSGKGGLSSPLTERPSPSAIAERSKGARKPDIAPAEAARRASREYGGRVLNVVLKDGPSGPYYRVKLLDGGRVRVVHMDAVK